ncbi:hypothetical protein F5X96DRAFT_613684 [Biscogniauxia mediterranea]|nr:hypothetical protein F5X96DRAFT_613684 [Biscogniauxia mediterranea]
MSSSTQNDNSKSKASASFDSGASAAMSNVEFSSSIYESPSSVGSSESTRKTQSTSLAGEPISEQDVIGSGTVGKAQAAQQDNKQGSEKLKDTAGASSMIL